MNKTFFDDHIYSGEVIDISSFEKTLAFSLTSLKQDLFCIVITLLWGLHCYSGFVDLVFVARSQMCQKSELQIVCLDSCPMEFKHCMVAAYIKKIMHNLICVMCVCIQGR